MSHPELSSEQKQLLVKELKEISRHCDLDALAIVTREGESLAFFAGSNTDPDLLSAVSAAVLNTGEMVTNQIKQGNLVDMLIRGEHGFSVFSNAGDYILIGASKETTSIGLTLKVLREHSPRIRKILEE